MSEPVSALAGWFPALPRAAGYVGPIGAAAPLRAPEPRCVHVPCQTAARRIRNVRSLAEALGLEGVPGVFLGFMCGGCGHDQYAWCPFDPADRILTCAECGGTKVVRVSIRGSARP